MDLCAVPNGFFFLLNVSLAMKFGGPFMMKLSWGHVNSFVS